MNAGRRGTVTDATMRALLGKHPRRSQTTRDTEVTANASRRGMMPRHGTTHAAPPPTPCGGGTRTPSVRRGAAGRLGRLVNHAPQEPDTCAARRHRHCGRSATPEDGHRLAGVRQPARRAAPRTTSRVAGPRAADAEAGLATRTVDPKCGACAVATSPSPIASCAGRGRASGRLRRPMPARHPQPPRRASAHRRGNHDVEPRGAARGGLHDVELAGGARYRPAAGSEPLLVARVARRRD